jgi:hypothetical protein
MLAQEGGEFDERADDDERDDERGSTAIAAEASEEAVSDRGMLGADTRRPSVRCVPELALPGPAHGSNTSGGVRAQVGAVLRAVTAVVVENGASREEQESGVIGIKALIAEKRAKIELLERHIEQLQAMAAEEVGMILPRQRRQGELPERRPPDRYMDRVRTYLREHPGYHRMMDIAAAVGCRQHAISGSVARCVESGEMVRGDRGHVKLAENPPKPSDRRRRKRKSKRAKPAKPGNGVGESRVARIRSYLEQHPDGAKAADIQQAIGMTSADFWGSVSHDMKTGRLVRPGPGLVALGKAGH